MAYRTLYWQGSTAQSISSFDFSVATNWKEYLFRDGKYGVYTPTSSPSYADDAYIGDNYMYTGSHGINAVWMNKAKVRGF